MRFPSRIRWWSWFPRLRYFVAMKAAAADEIPDRLPRKAVVVVSSGLDLSWLAFDCPCPDRHRIMLNLDAARRPRWRVLTIEKVTIEPSIDVVRPGRRCHFWLRDGRIVWCP